jgi:lipoprotein-anchoring transpeptidase ErfK/SrfK
MEDMTRNPFGPMISRRTLLAGLATAPLAACNAVQHNPELAADENLSAWYTGFMPDGEHEIPLVDKSRIKPEYRRQNVAWTGGQKPGTIVVDIDKRFLYLVQDGGTALRYGVGVGREGFSWKGTAVVGRKGAWPGWSPTTTMVSLKPDLPRYMKGGIDNPLGARALYLHQDGRDILFRIHGTNEPWTIGQAVSSGCIRMLNEDIHDLYSRVPVGTTVMVRRNGQWRV